jgi:hypothetical protein
MAHVSTSMSQLHSATAVHLRSSTRLAPFMADREEREPFEDDLRGAEDGAASGEDWTVPSSSEVASSDEAD